MIKTKYINLLANSNPQSGATNVSSNGSSFTTHFGSLPLELEENAYDIELRLVKATIWNTTPNVFSGQNSEMSVVVGGTTYNLSFPTGLYSAVSLNEHLSYLLTNEGLTSDVVEFIPDYSINKMVLNIKASSVSVIFQGTTSIASVIGFNLGTYSTTASETSKVVVGQSTPLFNSINDYIIHCDLLTTGVRINKDFNQALDVIPITADIGRQIVYEPSIPRVHSVNHLSNEKRSSIRLWLTDENNNLVDTAGEYWQALMEIKYKIK